MKLIYAIVNNDDSAGVSNALVKAGHSATKIASAGGFLKAGNDTFLICSQDNQVDNIIEIIKKVSRKRRQYVPSFVPDTANPTSVMSPIEVSVGGATIFVTDIERFEKV